ncbi:YeiH family protein [Psychrobacter sanguinis]|uniref:YeiH family protein n=1 Tax=Psychrobacter sanguinis TaxID=861445 RepID=UPI002A7506E1|nr:YeiH family protein [Psychrobacter sanguinis]MDY3305624.1 YeiH family protein [Psychrobacter sanguinis]
MRTEHPTFDAHHTRTQSGHSLSRFSNTQLILRTRKTMGGYFPKQQHLLGLSMVLLGSLFSIWLNDHISDWTDGKLLGLSSLTLAILIGMVLGNTLYPRFAPSLSTGVTFSKAQILRLAIVLYGFKITLTQVASVGFSAVVIDALVLSSTFIITYLLGTKWLKMDRTTTLLIGSGASICGAAAVIAAEPVVKAEAHKVTIAVATVVVFGTLAMMLYPMLYQMGWLAGVIDAQHYGIYIGSTIHEVAQVVVAGNAISPEAGNTAVVTKMIRVMMLAPFLLLLSVFINSTNTKDAKTLSSATDYQQNQPNKLELLAQRLKQIHVPWFAFVFIAMVAVNSFLMASPTPMIQGFTERMIDLDNILLTMAMFALGLTTHFSAIKQAGIKPLILAAVMFFWLILGGAMINVLIGLI